MPIGFKALEARYTIALVQPLRVASRIGTVRKSLESADEIQNQYPPSYRPADDFAGHFEFGLKYEEIHLEFFCRLFAATGPQPLEDWCRREPSGQYARRAGFLYEWLTGQRLALPDTCSGGCVDAQPKLPDSSSLSRRHRMRNQIAFNQRAGPGVVIRFNHVAIFLDRVKLVALHF